MRARARRRVPILWVLGFTLAAGSAMPEASGPERDSSATARFLSRPEEPLRAYRAFRRMHAWSDRFKQEAWLDAWTELKDGRFEYQIITERGSDTIRNRVLRAMLKREQELVNSGDAGRGELTPANYEFGDAARGSDGAHVVPITPRRKDVMLVEGRMVLSPDDGDLLRVEGRLSKNPSFWTSLVNVVRHYARLGGVRVPVATESTAKVKFAGTSQLEVAYEYETVNGHPVRQAAQPQARLSHTAAR